MQFNIIPMILNGLVYLTCWLCFYSMTLMLLLVLSYCTVRYENPAILLPKQINLRYVAVSMRLEMLLTGVGKDASETVT